MCWFKGMNSGPIALNIPNFTCNANTFMCIIIDVLEWALNFYLFQIVCRSIIIIKKEKKRGWRISAANLRHIGTPRFFGPNICPTIQGKNVSFDEAKKKKKRFLKRNWKFITSFIYHIVTSTRSLFYVLHHCIDEEEEEKGGKNKETTKPIGEKTN